MFFGGVLGGVGGLFEWGRAPKSQQGSEAGARAVPPCICFCFYWMIFTLRRIASKNAERARLENARGRVINPAPQEQLDTRY